MLGHRQTILLLLAAGVIAGGCDRKQAASVPPPAAAIPTTNAPHVSDQAHMTSYYDAPFETQKRMEFFGKIPASPPTGTEFPLQNFRLIAYKTNGDTEIILTAPECVLSHTSSGDVVNSAGPLHAQTGDGSFAIDGTGFVWRQDGTNSTLVISNDVVTTVQKGLLASGAPPTNATAAVTGSNDFVHVYSDHFFFDRNASLVTYSGNVRAEDEQLRLRADLINLRRGTNGAVNNLIADTNVVITDRNTGSRTTGEHAEYSVGENGAQLVTLTGQPRWESGDGLSEGTAKAFVFDRAANTFQARDEARFRLAATGNSDTGFFLAPEPAATNAAPGSPKFADVNADTLTLQLPPAKGPPQRVVAEGHVVIVDETGGSRTTADKAVYVPAAGALDLIGHARYAAGERLASADFLTLNRNTQSVFARTNALLKFPPTALGQSVALHGLAPGKVNRTTNGTVEVTANTYEYENGMLTFHDHVQTVYSEAGAGMGKLDCGSLAVTFHSNLVERIVAEQDVRLREPPTLDARGRTVEGGFNAQRVEIQMRTNGLVKTMDASGGITASNTETYPNGGKITHLGLSASTLNARFLPNTNQVESATANGDVHLTDNEMTAQGARLDYTSTNDTAILTGNPLLLLPGVRVSAEDGIIYDNARKMVRVQGRPQTLATVPVNGSNARVLLSPSGKLTP